MPRATQFNSPFLLGFDQIERVLDRVSKSTTDGYPPYNIEQLSEGSLQITLAVAGFTQDQLAVTVEDNQLVIRGRQTESEDDDRVFLHRGIAARQFQRSFVLADGIEVAGAELAHGLLSVRLNRLQPRVVVKTIEIADGEGKAAQTVETAKIGAVAKKS